MNVTSSFNHDVLDIQDFNFILDTDVFILCCDIVILLAAAFGIVGNTLICVCIIKSRSLRTHINASLMSTLIGNLVACVTLLPLRVYLFTASKTDEENWDSLCSAAVFFRTFNDTLQLFMLITVSYERYQSVANPFKKNGRAKRTTVLIGLSWTASSGLSFLSAFLFVDSSLVDKCLPNTPTSRLSWGTHDLYLIFPFGIGTLFIIIVFYSLIMLTLLKHRKKMHSHTTRRKNRVVPQKNNEDFKGVDKSSSNSDISAIKLRTPQHFNISMEKSSKYSDFNLDVENKINNTESIQGILKDNKVPTSGNPKQRNKTNLLSINSNDKSSDKQTEQLSVSQENVQNLQPGMPESDNKGIEQPLEIADNSVVENIKNECTLYKDQSSRMSGEKAKDNLNTDLNLKAESLNDATSAYNQQKPVDCVNTDCVIRIYDINGVVNRVSTKDTTYSGSVCVMNSQSRELGKRKVEARAAKRIAIMIGVFTCLWIPLPLTVLVTRHSEFTILQAHSLIVTATLGMCSVVINPLLHSVLNRQLHASLKNMVSIRKCGCCTRHDAS